MEEASISRGASLSGDSNISTGPEIPPLDDRLTDVTSKTSLNFLRTPPTKKAKRVRFFRNGDKFYTGVVMAVTPERYRSFDSLASDLTRALVSSVTLPNGVRSIYTMDGKKVQTVNDLEDGKCYVVSGQGELFKKVEYSASKVRRGSSLSGLPQLPTGNNRQISSIPTCVKAKIITLIRNGSKPRKVVRLLLNKRNSPSYEHVFEAITDAVKLDSGAVRRVYTLSGKPVIALEQFFETEEIFVAYGTDKSVQEDFELDNEESKNVQSFRRGPFVSRRQGGPMPVMPRKSGKRALTAPQVRTPSPSALILPQPLRLHYAVGHVIGDGNFAVVRHCIHKTTGAEYALKIVDKYKCQGKETMLASEVAILRQVCHPNIISLIGEQETVDQLFLVMELVKGGDLFDAIAAARKFSEPEASVMIGHLTSALAYLHSHHIVHRDVKPENLLVEMEGSQVRCLKLGDFGLAQVVREPLYTVCGTPTYVAPEILAESGYGLKIDVWAAGVILYILLCGFPPFVSENDQEELFERILSGQYEFTAPYWDPISDSAKQLISNMLQAQPELRFSAEDVLDHPWLVSFLGVEPTVAGGGSNVESSKQHRNKQCQPLRLATFEFDYKKQRRVDVSIDKKTSDSNDLGTTTVKNQWLDASANVNEAFHRSTITNSLGNDEIDDSNVIDDNKNVFVEPSPFSVDCLRDIRDLTSSLHDLTIEISDRPNHEPKTTKNPDKSSFNRVDTSKIKFESTKKNNVDLSRENSRSSSPSIVNQHSVNTKNGNSLKPIHSNTTTTPKTVKNDRRCVTPEIGKNSTPGRSIRPKPTNLCKAGGFGYSRKVSNDSSVCDRSCEIDSTIERLSRSTDGINRNSDNNIETSDSFVNIKLAEKSRKRGKESISTTSIESVDNFENTKFSSNSVDKNPNDEDSIANDRPSNDRTPNSRRICEISEKKKFTTTSNRQNRSAMEQIGGKISRPSLIPVQNNGQSRNPMKFNETTKIILNETVKMREKKIAIATNLQTKNDGKNKRSSCFTVYTSKLEDSRTSNDVKFGESTIVNGRKCNSTDDLREEEKKIQSNAKTKRHSLYYTPQPSRKNYETDNKSLRNTIKRTIDSPTTSKDSNSRPISWKTPEIGKRTTEEISMANESRREFAKNRKSLVESSTSASRSKTNRQSVHIRSNAGTSTTTNFNLPPGRTK